MKIPKFLKKKRNLWITVILVVVIVAVGYFVFIRKNNSNSIQTGFVTKQNLEETVLSTGQVVSGTDLNLSFQGSGVVKKISVKEGDKVYKGQLLTYLDQSSALASLASAQGSLAQAQANYDKLINGATQNDIRVLQDSVTAAKVNLNNTYNSAFTILNNSYTAIYNAYTTVTYLQNNYFTLSDQEGIRVQNNKNNINDNLTKAKFSVDQTGNTDSTDLAISNLFNYLSSTFNSLQIIRDQCDSGIYYSKISATDKASIDTQKTYITTAMSNISTLQNNIASYKSSLQTV